MGTIQSNNFDVIIMAFTKIISIVKLNKNFIVMFMLSDIEKKINSRVESVAERKVSMIWY